MDVFFILVIMATIALWLFGATVSRNKLAEADEAIFIATSMDAAAARAVINQVGKPRNRLALNEPRWETESLWTRRFDKGSGKRHSDAVLEARVFRPGSSGSPAPDHRAGVVVSIEVSDAHFWRQYGIYGVDAISHALKVRRRLLAALSTGSDHAEATAA